MSLARKSVKQRYSPSGPMLAVLENFRRMTNDCVRNGLRLEKESGQVPSMKRLSLDSYGELRARYGGYSQYALCAISKAAGILSARSKSIRRGFLPKTPFVSKQVLVSCYGFKIVEGNLVVHLDGGTYESIPLNAHTRKALSDPNLKVRSFTLTRDSLSLCLSKDVKDTEASQILGTLGIDRNLRNLAVGDGRLVTFYDLSSVVAIGENTREIVRSLKRNDARIRSQIASKYGRRRRERTRHLLNLVSKRVIEDAKARKRVIVFEEITGIRQLFRKSAGRGRALRATMNSWSFSEIKRQIQYKAAWDAVPVITLTRGETKGTTMDCPRCGERLQVPVRGDNEHYRQLWCDTCKRWRDRDLVAVLNISHRGRLRFDRSQQKREGEAEEAVNGNVVSDSEPLILRVDVSKLRHER